MSVSVKESATTGWLHKQHLLTKFNIGVRTLDRWVAEGYVRSAKIDHSKQGRRLFCVVDVELTLNALASGQEPRRNAGRR